MSDATQKPLRRSSDKRILLGICGGLGEFLVSTRSGSVWRL